MKASCYQVLAMPQEQRSDDAPDIGESAGQFGFWEIDLGADLDDTALTLSDTTCAIYGLGPGAWRLESAHCSSLSMSSSVCLRRMIRHCPSSTSTSGGSGRLR